MHPQQLIDIVHKDPYMTEEEKRELVAKLSDPHGYEQLIHGVAGAGIGLAVSKFMNLPKTAQVLLSIAGFGIGKYLLDESRKHDKFLQYNEKLKTYEIKA